MLVTKTINNNIVECEASDGKPLIAMGRGLGFDFKPGSELDNARVERVFSMDETRGYGSIQTLFSSVPEELLDICIAIIDKAREDLNIRLNDSIYITLTDHLHFAITKAAGGISQCSAVDGEVKVFYPAEYMMGRNAIQAIKNKLGVELPEEEACTIALHIVNAEYNSSIGSILKITRTITDIITIISHHTGIEIHDDRVDGAAFISYLKYFVFRFFTLEDTEDMKRFSFPLLVEREMSPEYAKVTDTIGEHLYKLTGHKLSALDRASLISNIYFLNEYSKRSSK